MKRILSIGAALLLCSAAAMAQYTNILDGGGTEQTVTNAWSTDSVSVGITTPSNALYIVSGGVVTSTNGYVGTNAGASNNLVSVTGSGSWTIEDTLEIGTGTSNVVSVGGGGTITVRDLVITSGNDLNIDNGGTFSVSGDYDADAQTNVNWISGGTLSVGGTLKKSNGLDGVNRTLVVKGEDAGWDPGGDLTVSGTSNTLSIVAGAAVTNDNGYVGYNTSESNNTVSVSGADSVWENTGNVYIGFTNTSSGNAVTVSDGGRVEADGLVIEGGNSFNLDSGGTLAISGAFNIAQQTNLAWDAGGLLSLSGELSGLPTTNLVVNGMTNDYAFINGGHDIDLNGGSLPLGTTNLIVGYLSSGSDLSITNGATVVTADGYIGWGDNSANNSVLVSGTGSTWTNGRDLWVGYGADNNKLEVSSGGSIDLAAGSVYIGNVDSSNNRASVAGTNSRLNIAGDLVIGGSSNSVENSLSVSDRGQVEVAGNVTLRSGNSISLASGGGISLGSSMNIYGDTAINGSGTIEFGAAKATLAFLGDNVTLDSSILFSADAGFANEVIVSNGTFQVAGSTALPYENFQTLNLIDSTLNGFGTIDADTFGSINMIGGVIDPAGDDTGLLKIDGTFVVSGTTNRVQVYETRNDELVFTGAPVNLDNMAIDVLVVTAPADGVTIMSATNGLSGNFYETNLVDRLLLYNAVLQVTNNEVQISLEADPLESSMEFAATEMIRAGFNGMKNSVFIRTKQLRRNLAATAYSIPNEVYLLTNTNAPAGARGPGNQNTIFDMNVWLQHSSGRGDFDSQGAADGFALNNHGTTIGADRLVGEALTLGLNYTYARSSARTTGMDDLDAETYWLGAYGEWVGEQGLYVDALVAYGLSNYDTERREEDYQGTASYDGRGFGAYADVGQYYHSGNLALSPYAGIHVLTIVADGHNETDGYGSSVYVDEVSRNLVESAFGLKMRHRFDTRIGRFQTTGYAEWAHDFIEDDVSATLTAAGFSPVGTTAISPDADTVNVGLGYSWISREYMEVGIGYNGRFSENYEEHAGSLMLDIMF